MRKKPKKPKANKGRAIRDTDIVYSCVTDNGGRIRFTLHPEDMRPECFGPKFAHRAMWSVVINNSVWLSKSCYSPGPYIDVEDSTTDARWLDWLAEGEPGRGGA